MVSTASIITICFSLLVALIGPVLLAIIFLFKNRPKPGVASVFAGAGTFILFALILEQLLHFLILKVIPGLGDIITGNVWLLAFYGSIAAGVFEETGRFLVMKFILKKSREWKHGIAFGIGHGGIEAMILVGLTYMNNLIYSLLINSGSFDMVLKSSPSSAQEALVAAKDGLISTSSWLFAFAGVERILTFLFHVAMSVLVLYAVRSGKKKFFLLAIFLHFMLDIPAVFAQKGILPVWALEVYVAVFAVASLVFIVRSKKLFEKLPALVSEVKEEKTVS